MIDGLVTAKTDAGGPTCDPCVQRFGACAASNAHVSCSCMCAWHQSSKVRAEMGGQSTSGVAFFRFELSMLIW